jgi:hypothetical protein
LISARVEGHELKEMTERRIYQKLNDLGYSNNAQRTNPKSGCTEEEEVAIFNFLLPKYDSAFALGDWLSTDERKTTILRYVPAPPRVSPPKRWYASSRLRLKRELCTPCIGT